ncbi:aconitase B [Bradyrhizobium sp. AZCC 1578]|uniref:hypothetical protein n=1 Tax=Bradyrhizobium sp. AZCC 1578 TaxID=3117027 RepID=UPI002FF43427
MPETGTSGLMSGERKRNVAAWLKSPRLSSTLRANAGQWLICGKHLSLKARQIIRGKSLRIFRNRVKPWNQKYSASRQTQITGKDLAIPSRRRGALAIVTNVGTGCGGRGSVGRVDVIAGQLSVSEHSAQDVRRLNASVRSSAGKHLAG